MENAKNCEEFIQGRCTAWKLNAWFRDIYCAFRSSPPPTPLRFFFLHGKRGEYFRVYIPISFLPFFMQFFSLLSFIFSPTDHPTLSILHNIHPLPWVDPVQTLPHFQLIRHLNNVALYFIFR